MVLFALWCSRWLQIVEDMHQLWKNSQRWMTYDSIEEAQMLTYHQRPYGWWVNLNLNMHIATKIMASLFMIMYIRVLFYTLYYTLQITIVSCKRCLIIHSFFDGCSLRLKSVNHILNEWACKLHEITFTILNQAVAEGRFQLNSVNK